MSFPELNSLWFHQVATPASVENQTINIFLQNSRVSNLFRVIIWSLSNFVQEFKKMQNIHIGLEKL